MEQKKTSATQQIDSMDWTQEELQIWFERGLIPAELFDPAMHSDLIAYLRTNKAMLHSHYRRNTDNEIYSLKIPPPEEWGKTPNIQVIDKRTGEVVRVLEQMQCFELCEGIQLKIKMNELQEWEKETEQAKNLNKEQHEILKTALEKIGPDKPLTRKEIATLIEEIRKPQKKANKYRQSGHLVDQKLKYQKPSSQPSLFDALLPETKQKIEASHYERTIEGIKLSYAENKLIHALNQLLYKKSQHEDPQKDDFYTGNVPAELVPYGVPNLQAKAPVIKFKPSELYKAFMGSDEYSGIDIKYINSTLKELCAKKFLIKYDRIKIVRNGNKKERLTDRIEDFQSLISILSFIPDLSDEEKKALDAGDGSIRESRGEIIIALNPIFHDQIDTKYIEFPEDTNKRLVIAAGGHKCVTSSMQKLMEYVAREISAKRYVAEINEENLPYQLGLENYMKQSRKKLKERIDKDIEAIVNMGYITGIEKLPNSAGGMKWVFHLNKDYE